MQIKQAFTEVLTNLLKLGSQKFHEYEPILNQLAADPNVLSCIVQILPASCIQMPLRQQFASLLANKLSKSKDIFSEADVANLLLSIITNWSIDIRIKQMMQRVMSIYCNRTQGVRLAFRTALNSICHLLSHFCQDGAIETTYESTNIEIIAGLTVSINFSTDLEQLFLSSLLIAESLLSSSLKMQQQITNLLGNVKHIHESIFNWQAPSMLTFRHLFEFYQQLTQQLQDLRKKKMNIMRKIMNWPFLLRSMQLIYELSAVKSDEIFNYFILDPTQEETAENLFELKEAVSEFHVEIINAIIFQADLTPSLPDQENLINHSINFLESLFHSVLNIRHILPAPHLSQQSYMRNLLSTFSIILQTREINFSLASLLLHELVVPVCEFYLANSGKLLEDTSEFYKELMDCCETQYMDTFLTIISTIIETVSNKCREFHLYFMGFFKHALAGINQTHTFLFAQCHEPMSISTAFFLLSVLAFKEELHEEITSIFKTYICPEYCSHLNESELSMLFFYLSFGWPVVYGDHPQEGNFLVEAALNGCLPGPTRLFAVNFISQIEGDNFSDELVLKYLQSFNFKDKVEESWILMSKFILKFSKILNQNDLISLTQAIQDHLNSLITDFHQSARPKHYDTTNILRLLSLMRNLFKGYINYHNKPNLKQHLYNFLYIIKDLRPLHHDDEIVKIISHILRSDKDATPMLCGLLQQVAYSFKDNQMQGKIYFDVFAKYIESEMLDPVSLDMITLCLMLGITKYLQNDKYCGTEQCIYALNYQLTLLQNICLLYDGRIQTSRTKEMLQMTSNIIKVVVSKKKYKKELTIIGKSRILELIAATLTFNAPPLDDIIKQSKKDRFMGQDCNLLLYLLSLLPVNLITPTHQTKVARIVLNLLEANLSNNPSSDKIHFSLLIADTPNFEVRNYLQILQIEETSVVKFAELVLKKYKTDDWELVQAYMPGISGKEIKGLQKYISLQQTEQKNDSTPVNKRRIVQILGVKTNGDCETQTSEVQVQNEQTNASTSAQAYQHRARDRQAMDEEIEQANLIKKLKF